MGRDVFLVGGQVIPQKLSSKCLVGLNLQVFTEFLRGYKVGSTTMGTKFEGDIPWGSQKIWSFGR